jgi:membrane-associated protein
MTTAPSRKQNASRAINYHPAMRFFELLYGLLRHLNEDDRWRAMIEYLGSANLYGVLFLIVFAETGLVICPFLPGDSLLFAVGAVAARDVGINVWIASIVLIIAAVLGDAVNYSIGYRIGPKIFNRDVNDAARGRNVGTGNAGEKGGGRKWYDRALNRKHLLRAQEFYSKYGAKTIILARFVPIIRTFAPFVAGVGKMSYRKFALYNIIGAIAWVALCIGAGVFFGNIPFIRANFELVILAIVLISILPMAIEIIRARRNRARESTIVEFTTVGESAPPE